MFCMYDFKTCIENYETLTSAIRQFCINFFGNLTNPASKTERIAVNVSCNIKTSLRHIQQLLNALFHLQDYLKPY